MSKRRSYGRQNKDQTLMSVSLGKDLNGWVTRKAQDLRMSKSTYVRQLILRDMQDAELPTKGD